MSVVLILTHPEDVHANAVQAHLEAAGVQVRRFDTAHVGRKIPFTASLHSRAVSGRLGDCKLDNVGVVWHRRPSEFDTADVDDMAELRAGVGGVLSCLPHLNHPVDMARAAFKPYQLAVAGRAGLDIPETLISTEMSDAAKFSAIHLGNVIVKPMSSTVRHGRLVTEDGREGWNRAIHLTQQRIKAAYHARLTVVDGMVFAARIDSPNLDWRVEMERCTYQVLEVPAEIRSQVQMLREQLRLRFMTVDFVVDGDDRWWFLEVNPNGQYLWIEQTTGLAISKAVATALSPGL